MKAFGGLFVFGGLVLVGTLYMQAQLFSDHGVPIQIAYGAVNDIDVELHLVVPVTFPVIDPPKPNEKAKISWQDWIDDHFQLYDASDNLVPLKRSNHSRFIKQHKVIGTQEFFLKARLKAGADYVFEYVSKLEKAKRYHHSFTAPAGDTEVQMYLFEPAK